MALKNVPNKRLVELRKRFESLPSDITKENALEKLRKWTQSLEPLLKRGGRKTEPVLRAALVSLGQPFEREQDAHHWRELQHDGGKPAAHGMLDLLEAWDFAQDLTKGPEAYEPEEEDER